jgi:polar amino acid transport system permease protein
MSYDFDWTVLLDHTDLLLTGLSGTILLFVPSLVASSIMGILLACLRCSVSRRIEAFLSIYVELFRNIPPVVQLFFWAFATGLDTHVASFVGLSIFTSAYISEILRAGILSIPRTQIEAARSTGMKSRHLWTYVILPQALIKTLPALSVEFITLLKNTSIAMTIAYTELTFVTQEIESLTFRGFEAASIVTIMYILLCLIIVLLMYGVERLARANVRTL